MAGRDAWYLVQKTETKVRVGSVFVVSVQRFHLHERDSCDNDTHTHTCWFLWFTGTLHRRNGFYTVQTVCAIALHLPYT